MIKPTNKNMKYKNNKNMKKINNNTKKQKIKKIKKLKKTKTTKKTKNDKTKKHIYHLLNNHYQIKYDRKTESIKYHYTPILKGGKYIDKGGFGCVITPALQCSKTDINLDKSVSKIIKQQTDTLSKELKISNMLKKLDPSNKFYITIDNYCFINEIPLHRTDISNVKYKDESLSDFSLNSKNLLTNNGKKRKIDKKFCDIDLDLKPINLIMPYAGISLSSIMKTNRKKDNLQSKMHQLFLDNLKIYFKHLIIGLLKMHNNRIVNKDIKQRNIMLYWQPDSNVGKDTYNINNIMAIRYIDFGLSEFLTGDFCKDMSNITVKGTPFYIPPEIFISAFIIKYKEHSENYQIKKIMHYITKNVIGALEDIGEKEMISKMNSNIELLYKKIKGHYENNRILDIYFGSETNKFNGYIQKADVYALGLSIYETLYKYSNINVKKHIQLYDLLLHMIDINPDKRYNIIQCLSHQYFKEIK